MVDGFDYYYINQILVIPDPIPVARVNWNKNIIINDLTVGCVGSFLAFFHFNLNQDIIYADSLTLPEYVFLQNTLQCM
ncbi:hypothetical protein ACT1UG_26465 [Bacillus paramycoides]|uniref:hypothetical protein n=1 Tax=Bacillus paramycoides TaxID=2026194 RepID=UPI0040590351